MTNKAKEVWDLLIVGDTYHPVPKFVSDWINSPPDESELSLPYIEVLPDEILTYCELSEDDEDSEINLSERDWANERAMFITGYSECFDTLDEVNLFIEENEYQLGDEFVFYDY